MVLVEPIRYLQSAVLPYAPDLVFDLVADIERYPQFLEEFRTVHVRARNGDTLHVDQVIGLAAVELTLNSVATLLRPQSIVIRSDHRLLGDLEMRWDFAPADVGTRVDFRMALSGPPRFAASLAEHLLSRSATRILEAFAERAQHVYGPPRL